MPNFLDNAIAAVSPGWAARRAAARLRCEIAERQRGFLATTYGAAERSRLTADWRAVTGSADAAILPDQQTLNARARQAVRDDWAGASIQSGYRRHVIGTGITCRSAARDPQSGKPFDAFNKQADRLWTRWCRARWCDIERKKSFCAIQSLLVSELATVGQGFCILHEMPSRARRDYRLPGTVLQVIEPEMLDDTRVYNPANGYEIRGGIEIDPYGAEVAIWVYTKGHPLDNLGRGTLQSERISADRVCHLMDQDRPRQTHGVTRLAPVLAKLRHLGMYDLYNLAAARLQACAGVFIAQPPDTIGAIGTAGTMGPAGQSATDGDGNDVMNFEPGMVLRGKPGEQPTFFAPKSPGEYYEPFSKRQIVQIAAGARLDPPTVSRDFSGNTYSGQRQGMIERDYETDPLQALVIEILCMPVRDQVITQAILAGMLDAPGFFREPELMQAYLEADWRPQAKPWIDPANQSSAAETSLRNKLTTHRAILNEQGEDWRETFQQIADEENELRRLGIGSGVTHGSVGPDGEPAGGSGVPGGAGAGGGLSAGGLNGAQITAAVDVMLKLREKSIAPAAAVELLAAVGIDRARADQIVSETPIGLDNAAGDVAYKRDILKKLLDVPAAREAVYNATDVEDLIAQTGLSPEKGYQAPYIPVVAAGGPIVSGETITDPAGDVVGGDTLDDSGSADGASGGNASTGGDAAAGGDTAAGNGGDPSTSDPGSADQKEQAKP